MLVLLVVSEPGRWANRPEFPHLRSESSLDPLAVEIAVSVLRNVGGSVHAWAKRPITSSKRA